MLMGKHQALPNMLNLNVHITDEPLRQVLISRYQNRLTSKRDEHIGKLIPKISAIG